jgi:hypothetical protein
MLPAAALREMEGSVGRCHRYAEQNPAEASDEAGTRSSASSPDHPDRDAWDRKARTRSWCRTITLIWTAALPRIAGTIQPQIRFKPGSDQSNAGRT